MNDTDVDVVASLFSTYYGHLANTVEGWILSAPFYREFVCLGSADTAKREFFACVAVADGVVIGAIFLCFFPLENCIEIQSSIVHPDFRGAGCFLSLIELAHKITDLADVDFARGFAAVNTLHSLNLKNGWRVGGIMPGKSIFVVVNAHA